MKQAFFALTFALVAASANAQARVYVYTAADSSGIVDDASKARADAVRDIVGKLRGKRAVTVVDDQGHADLTLEVLSRQFEDVGAATASRIPGTGVTQAYANKRAAIHARLRSLNVDYSTEVVGGAPGTYLNAWGSAAGDVAAKVEKFVRENKDKLTEAR